MALVRVFQAFVAIFLIVLGAAAAHAQPLRAVPVLTSRVIDETATLSEAQRQSLQAQLAEIERTHGSQVVLLMVPTTAPEDIASFANRVASTWKIGRKDVGDGVLVIVAKDERRMRIEVARALEGAIPDIAAARIIDAAMAPRFREGDYAGGLQAAVQQIGARIAGEALPLPQQGGLQGGGKKAGAAGFEDLAVFVFFAVMVMGPVLRAVFGQRLGGLAMGAGAGALAFWFTTSVLLALGAAVAALLYTWIFAGRGVPIVWNGGGRGGGFGGGGFGGGGLGGGGGGFSSGGGGSFGGGGASGSW